MTTPEIASAPDEFSFVDWSLAVSTARRLAGAGPTVTADQAAEAVAQLRESAARSTGHVAEYTKLDASAGHAPVLVIDRGGWAQANADVMRELITPIATKLRESRPSTGNGFINRIGPAVTGVETGALLGFMASKVLGQYDPFYSKGGATGRLLLVAPNIVGVETDLAVDPTDFRMWVCLHEETHRVQFTANPWLTDHMKGLIAEFLNATDVDPSVVLHKASAAVKSAIEAARSGDGEGASIADLIQTPEQKEIMDRATAVMSLLEGHADVVMDEVGPSVVPSVATIRAQFQKRRAGAGGADRAIRRLLGLEAKMRQYRDGAVFVRAVIDKVGMDDFNQVWTSADTLPTPAEIADPSLWVARVPTG